MVRLLKVTFDFLQIVKQTPNGAKKQKIESKGNVKRFLTKSTHKGRSMVKVTLGTKVPQLIGLTVISSFLFSHALCC